MTPVRHEIEVAGADRYAPSVGPAGLLLGRDLDGAAAPLRLLRARPTRITVIGGIWLARILTIRALAVGGEVLVRTVAPGRWRGLGEVASGSAEHVRVVDGQSGPGRESRAGPTLHVFDLDGHQAGDFVPTQAWHTALTLGAELTGPVAEALPGAHAAVLQRTWPQQAAYAATVFGIEPDAVAPVAAMPDDMVAVLQPHSLRFVQLFPTSVERRLFGPPQR